MYSFLFILKIYRKLPDNNILINRKEYSAYEFLNWIDDICRIANKVRGDPPAKFEELRNIHQLLQEEVIVKVFSKKKFILTF